MTGNCPRCHRQPPNPEGCAFCSPEQLGERLAIALRELNEWQRGDVGQANQILSRRCVDAEYQVRELRKEIERLKGKQPGE